jgi:hypothetical protein
VQDAATGYYFLAAITSRGLPTYEARCGAGGIYTLITPTVIRWMKDWGVTINVRPTAKLLKARAR